MANNGTKLVTATGIIHQRAIIKLIGVTIAKIASSSSLAIYDAGSPAAGWLSPVKAATTTNGTFASAFANGQTIDGYSLVTGDRILLQNQTDQTTNGIYTVNASGAPTRTSDNLVATKVFVINGTTNGGKAFVNTNTSITIGTTNITYSSLTITPFYTVDGTAANNPVDLNLNCNQGLYGIVTGSAEYNVIYN